MPAMADNGDRHRDGEAGERRRNGGPSADGGAPVNYEQWREIAERKRMEDRRRASDEHRRRMESRQVLHFPEFLHLGVRVLN